MKKLHMYISSMLVAITLFTVMLCCPLTSSASDNSVQDDASLLTSEEISNLEQMITQIYDDHTINVRIYTVESLNGQNGTYYLDSLEDSLNIENGIFILIDMSIDDTSNRMYYINSFDSYNEQYFNTDRLDKIKDAAVTELKAEDYYNALTTSLTKIDTYANRNIRTDSLFFQTWFQALLCIGIAAIIVGCMIFTMGGKVTTTSSTYLNQNTSKIIGRYDHYIRTTIHRTKKESNNDSHHSTSGGHSSTSSSGHF